MVSLTGGSYRLASVAGKIHKAHHIYAELHVPSCMFKKGHSILPALFYTKFSYTSIDLTPLLSFHRIQKCSLRKTGLIFASGSQVCKIRVPFAPRNTPQSEIQKHRVQSIISEYLSAFISIL